MAELVFDLRHPGSLPRSRNYNSDAIFPLYRRLVCKFRKKSLVMRNLGGMAVRLTPHETSSAILGRHPFGGYKMA